MEIIFNLLSASSAYLYQLSDLSLLFLRLVVAAIFYVHGYGKYAFWKMQPSENMPAGQINLMKFISIAEMLGATAMALGFLTQFAAMGLGIIMLGAIYSKIKLWKTPFKADQSTGWEFDLMILAGCIALMTLGAGVWSLDMMLI